MHASDIRFQYFRNLQPLHDIRPSIPSVLRSLRTINIWQALGVYLRDGYRPFEIFFIIKLSRIVHAES